MRAKALLDWVAERWLQLSMRDWVILAAAFLLAVLFFVLSMALPQPWETAVQSCLLAAFVSLCGSILTNRWLFQDTMGVVSGALQLSQRVIESGLTDIRMDFHEINASDLIRRSENSIDIYGLYVGSWLSNHMADLTDFVAQKEGRLRLILLAPDASCVTSFEEKLNKAEPTRLREKIEGTTNIFQSSLRNCSTPNGTATLYYQPFPPAYSLFRFDDNAYIIPYNQSPGRGRAPAYLLKNSGGVTLFSLYIADLERLLTDYARPHWSTSETNV